MPDLARPLTIAGLLFISGLNLAPSARAAPVTSPITAVARLRQADDLEAAVKDVERACRGRLRRTLVDHPQLVGEAKRLLGQKEPETRKRALDLHRCFSDATFVKPMLVPRLYDADPGVVAYAAEVAARLESSAVVAPLLDRLEQRTKACLAEGLEEPAVEVCTWLSYAPGTGIAAAPRELRERAGELAAKMALESPYPKVREVAVETLAATRLKAHAATVKTLIRGETSGTFAAKNDPGLVARFRKRAKALARGD